MTTFNWAITKLHVLPEQDGLSQVVYAASWKCEGTDDSFSPAFSAITEGDEAIVFDNTSSFTAYGDLTEEKIWEWINDKIDREEIQTNLQIRITEQAQERDKKALANPDLPWVK